MTSFQPEVSSAAECRTGAPTDKPTRVRGGLAVKNWRRLPHPWLDSTASTRVPRFK